MRSFKGLQAMEFVVVIVIAVLVLTLGTGFVQNLFAGISGIGEQVIGKSIEDLKITLQRSGDKLGVTITDVDVAKVGLKNKFTAMINNVETGDACFKLEIRSTVGENPQDGAQSWFDYGSYDWIGASEVGATPIAFTVPTGTTPGAYKFTIVAKKSVVSGASADEACLSGTIADDNFQTYATEKRIIQVG